MEPSKPLVVPVTLKGENYLLWSRTTKIALSGRGLWSHIDLSLAPKVAEVSSSDDDDDDDEDSKRAKEVKWYQEDQTVLAILQNGLEASILEAYSYCETANELWETLKNVYGNITNLTRVFEVKKALNNLSQEDLEFTKHFGKYRSLVAELDMLRPSTMKPEVINERREQDKVFGLLLTLNPVYNDLIKHILRSDKLPSLDEVCSQIQREQGSHGLFGGKGELPTAHKGAYEPVEYRRNNNRPQGQRPWCEHCKVTGHIKAKCWVLHPHLRPRYQNDRREPRAHYGYNGDQGQAGPSNKGQEGNQGDFVKKSDLVDILKSLKESGINFFSHKPKTSLIVDSGASHHMISNEKMLSNIENAKGNVEIANGDKIPIKGIGNLNLFDKTSKAFYMPNFTSNLLSVRKTIDHRRRKARTDGRPKNGRP